MVKITVFERKDRKFDWRMVGANGEEMCGSLQGYETSNGALEGFLRSSSALISGGWSLEPIADMHPSDDAPDEAFQGNDEGDQP